MCVADVGVGVDVGGDGEAAVGVAIECVVDVGLVGVIW